jgi:hypothetical protein
MKPLMLLFDMKEEIEKIDFPNTLIMKGAIYVQ